MSSMDMSIRGNPTPSEIIVANRTLHSTPIEQYNMIQVTTRLFNITGDTHNGMRGFTREELATVNALFARASDLLAKASPRQLEQLEHLRTESLYIENMGIHVPLSQRVISVVNVGGRFVKAVGHMALKAFAGISTVTIGLAFLPFIIAEHTSIHKPVTQDLLLLAHIARNHKVPSIRSPKQVPVRLVLPANITQIILPRRVRGAYAPPAPAPVPSAPPAKRNGPAANAHPAVPLSGFGLRGMRMGVAGDPHGVTVPVTGNRDQDNAALNAARARVADAPAPTAPPEQARVERAPNGLPYGVPVDGKGPVPLATVVDNAIPAAPVVYTKAQLDNAAMVAGKANPIPRNGHMRNAANAVANVARRGLNAIRMAGRKAASGVASAAGAVKGLFRGACNFFRRRVPVAVIVPDQAKVIGQIVGPAVGYVEGKVLHDKKGAVADVPPAYVPPAYVPPVRMIAALPDPAAVVDNRDATPPVNAGAVGQKQPNYMKALMAIPEIEASKNGEGGAGAVAFYAAMPDAPEGVPVGVPVPARRGFLAGARGLFNRLRGRGPVAAPAARVALLV